MPSEATWSAPTPDCPYPGLWSAPDEQASELEVGDFIHGLVRLVKPRLVLETGCYHGDTTLQIGRALKANHMGHLHTCDLDAGNVEQVFNKLQEEKLFGSVHLCSGLDLVKRFDNVNLAFIDTADDRTRYEEILSLRLAPNAFVLLHDARRPVSRWVHMKTRWTQVFFPTPRGLSLYATR